MLFNLDRELFHKLFLSMEQCTFLVMGCSPHLSLPSPFCRHKLELGAVSPTDDFQLKIIRRVEKVAHLMEGVGVHSAHETLAYHGTIQFLLSHWVNLPAK